MQYVAIYDGFKNDKCLVTKCSKHRSRLLVHLGGSNEYQQSVYFKSKNKKIIYQLPPILIALQPIDLIKLFSIRSIHLYQVNVTLHFYE